MVAMMDAVGARWRELSMNMTASVQASIITEEYMEVRLLQKMLLSLDASAPVFVQSGVRTRYQRAS